MGEDYQLEVHAFAKLMAHKLQDASYRGTLDHEDELTLLVLLIKSVGALAEAVNTGEDAWLQELAVDVANVAMMLATNVAREQAYEHRTTPRKPE